MTPGFSLHVTSAFRRFAQDLQDRHPEFERRAAEAFAILGEDPYNRSRRHHVRKLRGGRSGEGEYRLALGRWRFIYDISGQDVILYYCGLPREDTYR